MKKLLMMLMGALLLWGCSDSSTSTEEGSSSTTYAVSGLSDSSLTFAAEGGSATVSFTTTAAWAATASESWCTVSSSTGSAGTNTITITAAANTGTDERNASVTITCGTASAKVTVSQKFEGALTVTSNKIEMDADGGEATITANYTGTLSYEIESTAQSWIAVATRATSSSTLTVTVAANTSKSTRQGQILVTNGTLSETVTVYQEGLSPELVLSNNTYTVASAGEAIAVEIKSNVDFTVVMPDASWITANTTRALSTYTLYYTIAENTTYEQRSATITYVNNENSLSESVTITQVQNDAIIVAAESYELESTAQALDFNVNSNVDFTTSVDVDWITQVSSRGLISKALCFDVAENTTYYNRTGTITFTYGSLTQTVTVKQKIDSANAEAAQKALERDMLLKIYESTNGSSWSTSTNWNTDADVSSWYGITCNDDGYVTEIALNSNGLTGTFPEDLGGTFEYLEKFKLSSNKVTGNVPAWWADYMHLGRSVLAICYNYLSGDLPEAISSHDNFKTHWIDVMYQRSSYQVVTDADIPGPDFSVTDLNGNTVTSEDLYANNSYTVISNIDHTEESCTYVISSFANYYTTYHDQGLEGLFFCRVWSSSSATSDGLASYMSEAGYEWPTFWWTTGSNYIEAFYTTTSLRRPMTIVVDGNGLVVWQYVNNVNSYYGFLSEIDGWFDDSDYVSTDYSLDGEVITLQTATQGDGINLVLLGEAFNDRDHVSSSEDEDDNYLATMKYYMEKLFLLEPCKSLRDYFNIYTVRVVSPTNNPSSSDIVINKTNDTAYAYAAKVSGITIPGVVVIYNTSSKVTNSYTSYQTDNSFVCYCASGAYVTVIHETMGHGVSHLADEYVSSGYNSTTITGTKYTMCTATWYTSRWWYRNADVTDDASSIKWAHFLSDDRYYGVENLGIYEGCATYGLGCYRPSTDSMMNTDIEWFNAPSRESIYRNVRTNRGSSTTYTYSLDDFLEYDSINRGTTSTRTSVNSTSWQCLEEEPELIVGSWTDYLK